MGSKKENNLMDKSLNKLGTKWEMGLCYLSHNFLFFILIFDFLIFETEGRHASAKAHEAIHHLASFPSSREEISQPGYEPPTSYLRFGYLSTITR